MAMESLVATSALVSLRSPEDFKRLLGTRPLARHAGWSLHGQRADRSKLSTGEAIVAETPVDDVRIGIVIARRSVRRAVTRNLIRRIWKELLRQELAASWCGWWLVLRRTSTWDVARFPSARSDDLRVQIRQDLEHLVGLARPRTLTSDDGGGARPAVPAL